MVNVCESDIKDMENIEDYLSKEDLQSEFAKLTSVREVYKFLRNHGCNIQGQDHVSIPPVIWHLDRTQDKVCKHFSKELLQDVEQILKELFQDVGQFLPEVPEKDLSKELIVEYLRLKLNISECKDLGSKFSSKDVVQQTHKITTKVPNSQHLSEKDLFLLRLKLP